MAVSRLVGIWLTGFKLTSSKMVGSGLFGSEMVRFGDQLDSELPCWLLHWLLDNRRVSLELLLIRLLLSSLRLL
jgi:hypothetical protein